MMNDNLIKEAGLLRERLKKGSFNLGEIDQFLLKIINQNNRQRLHNDRFNHQLENLERGFARKPKSG